MHSVLLAYSYRCCPRRRFCCWRPTASRKALPDYIIGWLVIPHSDLLLKTGSSMGRYHVRPRYKPCSRLLPFWGGASCWVLVGWFSPSRLACSRVWRPSFSAVLAGLENSGAGCPNCRINIDFLRGRHITSDNRVSPRHCPFGVEDRRGNMMCAQAIRQ